MILEAGSLYDLVSTWAEMQLLVSEEAALITGYGFDPDISWALTTLTLDWEATIHLPPGHIALPAGEYDLITIAGDLYACRNQEKFLLPDTPVTVEVVSVPE